MGFLLVLTTLTARTLARHMASMSNIAMSMMMRSSILRKILVAAEEVTMREAEETDGRYWSKRNRKQRTKKEIRFVGDTHIHLMSPLPAVKLMLVCTRDPLVMDQDLPAGVLVTYHSQFGQQDSYSGEVGHISLALPFYCSMEMMIRNIFQEFCCCLERSFLLCSEGGDVVKGVVRVSKSAIPSGLSRL